MNAAGGGYPSDPTDEQWALVEPLLPLARVGPKGGRREKHPRRRIVDAIFYVVRTGCAWRQLPKDFAPWPTVYWYFTWSHDDGKVERIHDALRGRVREAEGRGAAPSAGLIDSQSVRTADTVPAATRGFDAGKKVRGRFMISLSVVGRCSSVGARADFGPCSERQPCPRHSDICDGSPSCSPFIDVSRCISSR